MANFYEAFAQGQANGLERQKAITQRNMLAELQQIGPQVIAGDLAATDRAYALDPQRAQAFQAEGNRQQQQLFGLAKSLKQAATNPQMQAGIYRSAVPFLKRSFGAEIPDEFDAASVMPIVDQVLAVAQNAPSMGAGMGGGVQSTYVDDQGQRVAILRDGSTRVLGGNDAGSNQQTLTIDVNGTPTQVTFDRRTGRYTNASLGAPQGQLQQIDGQPTYIDPSLPPQVQAAIRAGGGTNLQDGGQLPIPQGSPLVGRRKEDEAAAVEAAKRRVELQYAPALQQVETQGAIDRAAGTAQVEAGAERQKKNQAIMRDARETLSLLDQAETLLNTASGGSAQAARDSVLGAFNVSTEGAKATAGLNVLAAKLVGKVPRFEGPQSDKDVMLYRQAAGDLANPQLPVGTRMAALQTMRDLNTVYANSPQLGSPQAAPARGNSAPQTSQPSNYSNLWN
ncbi:hypothetical protein [Stenotrophomonas maltophilia]|uniref:hypothetical protein n=1 Tax=Stenotrophomonas maltophilia TaxID=40324 RepID=UPI002E76AFEA|nr:hypothetical protein [Stenotrophomonas maltophilia]